MAYFGPSPQTIESGSLDSLQNLADLSNTAVAKANLGAVSFEDDTPLTASEQGQARANIRVDLLGGYRNKIINGDFDIWQRGISFTGTSKYTADRWSVGTANGTVTQQAFTIGQTDVPGNPRYFCRWEELAGTGDPVFRQYIESVRTLAGKKATITFYAKMAVAASMEVRLIQAFGTGGSASVSTVFGTANVGTTWQRFDFVVDVPSITGKTIGTANDCLGLILGKTGTHTFDIAHVSIVEGDATAEDDPFTPRHFQQELALCQRYYEMLLFGADQFIGAGLIYGSNLALILMEYEPKRTTPSIVYSSAAHFAIFQGGAAIVTTSMTFIPNANGKTRIDVVPASTTTSGHGAILKSLSTSGYMSIDAEL